MTGSTSSVAVEAARSFLFVPGNRPDRFSKAEDSAADVIILDLEDAVATGDKEVSRRAVVEWALSHERCVVRVNGAGTPWLAQELQALHGSGVPVMLPKAESVDQVDRVRERLGGSPLLALVETPLGVLSAQALAASEAVTRLAFGNVDLAAALGVDPASQVALHHARASLVLASAAANLAPPVDGVSTRLHDDALLADDVAHSREMGFGGKLCIHPQQVSTVNAAMSPSQDDVEWARRILQQAQDGVAVIDGAMVDAPVVSRARQIVARAATGRPGG